MGGDDSKTYQQPDARETEQFWTKIWQPREHNEKAEWINNITKELERGQRWPKSGNKHRFTQNNTKKISNWKTPGHDGIHGFRFKKFISIHDRLAIEMNRYQNGLPRTRMEDQRKDHIDPKGLTQGNCLIQLQTHNLPPDDVENINSTNNGRDLLTNRRLFPEE